MKRLFLFLLSMVTGIHNAVFRTPVFLSDQPLQFQIFKY